MNQEATLWHITGVRSFTMVAALAGVALAAAALAGCSKPAAQSCPNDLPAACPSPAPTFSADGEEPNPLLVSYDSITGSMDATARMVETQLVQCNMPPAGQPQLTAEERQTILGWLVCGAKDN